MVLLALGVVCWAIGIVYGLALCRAASREDRLRERLARGTDLALGGESAATLDRRAGRAAEASADREVRVTGWSDDHFFI